MIKAVFLDIDGTMVSFQAHHVPENTRKALHEARNNGLKLFVATGRHSSDIIHLGGLVFDGYMTLNGAICQVGNEVIFKKAIPQEDIAAFIRYEEEIEPIPCFFVEEDKVSINREDALITQMMDMVEFSPRQLVPSHAFLHKEIFQLTAFFPAEREFELLKHFPNCELSRWYPTFADLVARGVDKSVGLEKIGAYCGFSADEMMAIGDGGNDISMIRYAGIGVAMENANDEVKSAANYITTSVENDGVGNALRHFGLI